MTISRTFAKPRYKGMCCEIDFAERPKCQYCGKPMRIVTHGKPVMRIGLYENYETSLVYYRCGQAFCLGRRASLLRPSNPYCADDDEYDYEVKAKVCELRWTKRLTYAEVEQEMEHGYGIQINHSAIEIILKMYEIGCETRYRPDYLAKIQARGGILIQLDAMKPLKGKAALYSARDHYSGLHLSSKHLMREGHQEIAKFLQKLKTDLADLNIPILGIISDAHRGQLIAIEAVFGPDIPHSLCHFHFFELILKKPKALDSQIVTNLRQQLRDLYYIQEYRKSLEKDTPISEEIPFIDHVLHDLYTLSNWTPRKKDPCFSSLPYFQRIQEIATLLTECVVELDIQHLLIPPKIDKRLRTLSQKLATITESVRNELTELDRIKHVLQQIADILENNTESAEMGFERLTKLVATLNMHQKVSPGGAVEQEFVRKLTNFVKTKGAKLFTYRALPDAPRTNNSQEIAFKQLKHFLRRTIGYESAGAYLLAHGEYMLFVNPDESFSTIIDILKTIDWTTTKQRVSRERTYRNVIMHIIHDPDRWKKELAQLREKWTLFIDQMLKRV